MKNCFYCWYFFVGKYMYNTGNSGFLNCVMTKFMFLMSNLYHNITVGSRDAGLFAYRRQLFLDVSFLTVQGLDFFLQLLACHLTQLQSLVQACTDRKSNNIVEVK